ncbi:hypothetical protein Y032_0619g727 [Ancylostoma ceylanicum]|uniref:Uncharacterized protein n=1 Tax=Ancylostoma ceylanicum TaxID=53326 RepID=A0A016WL00_9BILA|nr:hypothetical protein Y032_0619g727 [Ancylostoma ceylanicum]
MRQNLLKGSVSPRLACWRYQQILDLLAKLIPKMHGNTTVHNRKRVESVIFDLMYLVFDADHEFVLLICCGALYEELQRFSCTGLGSDAGQRCLKCLVQTDCGTLKGTSFYS